jgi:hypothetical protein
MNFLAGKVAAVGSEEGLAGESASLGGVIPI